MVKLGINGFGRIGRMVFRAAVENFSNDIEVVGIHPESDRDDDFKGVHVRVQPVFKLHVAAHLVVVQHVRLADGSDGGLLADRFGKYAPEPDRLEGFPVRSFPIEINDVPQEARTLALAFIDYDAIPVGGFCWIHWTACNLPATTTLIPEDASRTGTVDMVQGRNSNWSPMAHGSDNPQVHSRYCGPQPPDATHSYTLNVYALDCELGLPEGFYLNELRRAMSGHVLDQASVELPSRA